MDNLQELANALKIASEAAERFSEEYNQMRTELNYLATQCQKQDDVFRSLKEALRNY